VNHTRDKKGFKMANISDAKGRIIIHGDASYETPMKVAKIIEKIASQSVTDYPTEILNVTDKGCEVIIEFVGLGRWTYSANVERFFEFYNIDYRAEQDSELRRLVEEVEMYDFLIIFEYDDLEMGENIFYYCKQIMWHKYDEKLSDCRAVVVNDYDLDLTIAELNSNEIGVNEAKWQRANLIETAIDLYEIDESEQEEFARFWKEKIEISYMNVDLRKHCVDDLISETEAETLEAFAEWKEAC